MVAQNFVAAPLAGVLFAVAAALPFVAHSAGYVLAAVLVLMLPLSAGRPDRGAVEQKEKVTRRSLAEGIRFLAGHPGAAPRLGAQRRPRDVQRARPRRCSSSTSSEAARPAGGRLRRVRHGRRRRWGCSAPCRRATGWSAGSACRPGHGDVGPRHRSCRDALCGFVPHVVAASAGLVFVGGSVATWNIVSVTRSAELVPSRLLGRCAAAWRTLGWRLMPVGALAGGLLGSVDLRLPFIVGGIGVAVAGLVVQRNLLVLSDSD